MDAHEVLVKARNLLEREGWAQGPGSGSLKAFGPACAGGALHRAEDCRDVTEAHHTFGRVLGLPGAYGIVRWNDAPERTKEEVLAAFDEAIRRTAPEPQDPFASAPLDYSAEIVAMP